jgi:hypothetical protein
MQIESHHIRFTRLRNLNTAFPHLVSLSALQEGDILSEINQPRLRSYPTIQVVERNEIVRRCLKSWQVNVEQHFRNLVQSK